MAGYRRAARHFGFRTLVDPTSDGNDDTRILIHRSASLLHEAAKVLSRGYASDNETDAEEAELWLARESGVHWFHHDWERWDADQDLGALQNLRWKRRIVPRGDSYVVPLRIASRRSKGIESHG